MGGTNFILHYNLMKGNWRNFYKDIEIRYLFLFIVLATILVMVNLFQNNMYNQDLSHQLPHQLLLMYRHYSLQLQV